MIEELIFFEFRHESYAYSVGATRTRLFSDDIQILSLIIAFLIKITDLFLYLKPFGFRNSLHPFPYNKSPNNK